MTERVNECKEACDRGRIHNMYDCLRKIGTKRVNAAESCMISISDFKSNFESVSRERFEEDPNVIESVIERLKYMSMEGRVMVANEHVCDVSAKNCIIVPLLKFIILYYMILYYIVLYIFKFVNKQLYDRMKLYCNLYHSHILFVF